MWTWLNYFECILKHCRTFSVVVFHHVKNKFRTNRLQTILHHLRHCKFALGLIWLYTYVVPGLGRLPQLQLYSLRRTGSRLYVCRLFAQYPHSDICTYQSPERYKWRSLAGQVGVKWYMAVRTSGRLEPGPSMNWLHNLFQIGDVHLHCRSGSTDVS